MNFNNLRYFLEVAQDLSFTKAAQKLYMSQQSLSSHIGRLEQEFGVRLFERSPRLKLTHAGRCVADLASRIIDLEDQMERQIADIGNQRKGFLAIGASHTRGRVFLPEVLPLYVRRYPHVEFQLQTGISKVLEASLLQGELDLIVAFTPIDNENISTVPVLTERFCAVIPQEILDAVFPNSRQAAAHFFEKGIDITPFCEQPFLLLERKNRLRDMADRYLKAEGIAPNILLESADVETLIALCFKGMGITFSFETFARKCLSVAEQKGSGSAHIFPVGGGTNSDIVLAYRKDRYLSKAAKDFIALSLEVFGGTGGGGAEKYQ